MFNRILAAEVIAEFIYLLPQNCKVFLKKVRGHGEFVELSTDRRLTEANFTSKLQDISRLFTRLESSNSPNPNKHK